VLAGIVPPIFRSTLIAMQEDRQDQRRPSEFALPVSIGLHLLVVALLIFGLPRALDKPANDEAVAVDLVPPPEAPPKPEAEPPAPQAEVEKQQEKPAEASPPANDAPARQAPVRSVSPVVQFGEKDAGPRKTGDGNSAEEAAAPSPQETPDEKAATPQEIPPAPDKETVLSLPDAATTPTPRPAEAAGARKSTQLKPAKTLFSRSASGDALATSAMRDLPREVRGGTLCVTELRAQLLNGSPPYFPDLLPSFPLKQGTAIDVANAAFRAEGRWRELSYRCEVDAAVTKVTSFALRIGEPIPRSEWERRGLPTQ
jgi:hypothetical protein